MRLTIVLLIFAHMLILNFESLSQSVEVVILGIAQDAGHPQAGCDELCCSKAFHDSELQHRVACIGFTNGESFYLVDATPDFTMQLGAMHHLYPNQNFGGIFLTHAHIGHYTGLMYLGREAMSAIDLPVYVMPRMKEFIETNGPWGQLIRLHNIELHELKDEQPVVLGDVFVTPFLVPHRDEYSETVGFDIRTENKSLIYIPDIDKWERWDRSKKELINSVDYALLDATFFDGNELPNRNMAEIPHAFVVESLEEFSDFTDDNKAKIKFIHLNHTNPLLNMDSDATRVVEKAGMTVAKRGERIQL